MIVTEAHSIDRLGGGCAANEKWARNSLYR
jgi:hypothetical protein